MTVSLAPMPQTQQQQEQFLIDLRRLLKARAPKLRADHCRHQTVTDASLWIFDGESQIGSISRDGTAWRTSAMHRGSPISSRRFVTLEHALEHILDATKAR
jgi:hypothetical protein